MADTKQLFIPDKIKIGYQKRGDTYTGKLAYIIYYDKKGVLRKEKSWQSWCNDKIKSQEVTNEPIEGFVLNKGVGGVRQSYGWNTRNEYIRVYDPRDFEFEISVSNLLFILRECDCSRGKGLEGKFVYAWDGTTLVLLPITAQDYKVSQEFTELQGKKVSARDLIKGATYTTKNNENYVYIGRMDRYRAYASYGYDDSTDNKSKAKDRCHIFWDIANEQFYFPSGMNRFAVCANEQPVSNYAHLVDKYYNSIYGTPVKKLMLVKAPEGTEEKNKYGHSQQVTFAFKEKGGFRRYQFEHQRWHDKTTPRYIAFNRSDVTLEDGILTFVNNNDGRSSYSYPPDYPAESKRGGSWAQPASEEPWVERKPQILVAVLESGAQYKVDYQSLGEKFDGKNRRKNVKAHS